MFAEVLSLLLKNAKAMHCVKPRKMQSKHPTAPMACGVFVQIALIIGTVLLGTSMVP
jgi:hypothetical protein